MSRHDGESIAGRNNRRGGWRRARSVQSQGGALLPALQGDRCKQRTAEWLKAKNDSPNFSMPDVDCNIAPTTHQLVIRLIKQ